MAKNIYITEKPSVASSFASVLNMNITKADRAKGFAESDKSIVTWCFGHLVTLAFPDAYDPKYKKWSISDLPIIPDNYLYKVIENDGIQKQFDTIKTLMNREDVDMIYSCTDSGREGEYIYRLVYQHAESNKPAKRVWISSFTEEAVKQGIISAKSISDYDPLSSAAYNRAKEDWLFGMNFSRLYTCKYGYKLSTYLGLEKSTSIAIGRVMTCVLGLIVERELEIRHFISKKHYSISATFKSKKQDIQYIGKWQQKKEKPAKKDENDNSPQLSAELEEEKYITKEEAQKAIDSLTGKSAVIKKVQIKTKKENPPLLFNLAELQSEANKKFKYPVDKTLEIAQSLYEKKFITYPRTDARVISTDVVDEIPKILNGLFKNANFNRFVTRIKEFGKISITKKTKRYVDNSKITDHYALIPTYVTPDLRKLDESSKNIYSLITKRFLAALYPPAVYNTVRVETGVSDELFVTNSKTLKDPGWKEIYDLSSKKDEELSKSPIHKLEKKETCSVIKFQLDEKETKAPPRYTDGSLVITMEKAGKFIEDEDLREKIKTQGIGTSATRAGIIKKLKNIQYIIINNKTQVITPSKKGESIVEIVKATAKDLLKPALTASWEKGLIMLENRETTEEVFQQKLTDYVTKIIRKVKSHHKTF